MNDESKSELLAYEPILHTLSKAGNLDRLVTEARRILAGDPEDADVHFYLALALTDLGETSEARRHLDYLLSVQPEEARTHIAALCLFGAEGRWSKVRHHVAEGLRIDPDISLFHRYAAIAALQKLKMAEARQHITRARELAPDDADTVNLHIRIHGATETSTADAAKRLEDYRAALHLDPHNAALHHSMGEVVLTELADPVAAERAFREALRIEPDNRIYQNDLFQAVAGSKIVYRLFRIPSRAFARVGLLGQAIGRQPWRIIFLLLGFKLVLAYVAWLVLVFFVFWPGGKAYEWLLVSEIRDGSAASHTGLRIWFWLRRRPGWVRFGLFFTINFLLWGGLFALLGIPLRAGYLFVAIFVTIHLLVVTILWLVRRGMADSARRKIARRNSLPSQIIP